MLPTAGSCRRLRGGLRRQRVPVPSVIDVLTLLGGIAPARDLLAGGITEQQLRTAAPTNRRPAFPERLVRRPRHVAGRHPRISGRRHAVLRERRRISSALGAGRVPATCERARDLLASSEIRIERRKRLDLADPAVVIHWTGERRAPLPASSAAGHQRDRDRQSAKAWLRRFVVFESALRKGRFDRIAEESFRSSLPARLRSFFAPADRLSDSGTESLLKLALLQEGISFRATGVGARRGPGRFSDR